MISTSKLVYLACAVPFILATGVYSLEASDNDLYPPSGIPSNWITTCNFRNTTPCKIFYTYARGSKVNFALGAEDVNATGRSMPSIRFIATNLRGVGRARLGSKYLYPSAAADRKALCVSFRYRLTGSASLSLVEQPAGRSENEFWKDTGSNPKIPTNDWHFHTSQISQNGPVRIIFNAIVKDSSSQVAITDITLYNYTCTIKDGDNFKQYTGASRALTDAPYWSPIPNPIIPYEIQSGFTAAQKASIMRFFTDVFAKTCVRFAARTSETNYMNFIKVDQGSGCSADLGSVGQTKVTLEDDCFDQGYWNIAHMIMHGLGLRHEHVRPDRDNFVRVNQGNIDPTKVAQFNKRDAGNQAVLAVQYDYKSVMHFFKDQYSTNGKNTIEKKDDSDFDLSNRDGPTNIDYQKISAIYCNGVVKTGSTPAPQAPTTTTVRPSTNLTPCTTTTTLERTSGVITNDVIPGGVYRNMENCGWLLKAPQGKGITARVTLLDIEDSPGCSKDVLTIYDGSDWETAPIFAGLCGANRPVENYTSSAETMLVTLTTDSSGQSRGFQISYQVVSLTPDSGPVADASLSPVDCNFEQSTCAWAQGTSDLKWNRKKLGGLDSDRSSTAGTYVSLDATTATSYNQYGILKSSRVQYSDGYACFSFWFRIVGSASNVKLDVSYASNTGDLITIWRGAVEGASLMSAATSNWVQATIRVYDIDVDYYRLNINGTIVNPGRNGGIAVDDIILTMEECNADLPPPIDDGSSTDTPATDAWTDATPDPGSSGSSGSGYICDFEANFCKWTNSTVGADSNWIRFSGASTSGSDYGVKSDNTKKTVSGKYLLLNSIANTIKIARVEAAVPSNSGFKCFELYYFMYGVHLGRVRILARPDGSEDEMVLYEASGNKNNKWTLAQASVDGLNQGYKLIVEGFTTGQSDGDIGVDDFMLRPNDCYSEPLKADVPTTTPYTTPEYEFMCDFEDNAFCTKALKLQNDGSADLQFVTVQGAQSGGPSSDHSQGNSKGRYAVAKGGFNSAVSILKTKSLMQDQATCMTFWYWMSATNAGGINVTVVDRNGERSLYTINSANRYTGSWTNPQVVIPRTSGAFSIKIVAISGGSQSLIAIDDIEMSRNSKCSPMSRVLMPPGSMSRRRRQASGALIACRFGDNDFCDWTNNGKWAAVTTSATLETNGPDDRFAHVTSGRLTVSANNARTLPGAPSAALTSNLTGILTSPAVNSAPRACFRFYYKISGWYRGLPMDVLNVYVRQANNANKRRLIASLSASQTPFADSMDKWLEEKLTVFEPQGYQIIFEGTTGDSWIGTLAIDDIQLKPSTCPNASFQ